jgi:hypothetical protein
MRPRASTYDPATARIAAVNFALLVLVMRPDRPMREREFEALAIVVAVALARAERRAGGSQ